jgi:hypothetical protein
MSSLLLLIALALFLLLVMRGFMTAVARPRRYAYRLNPTVDWTRPEVQQVWDRHGRHLGRFLKEDQALTLEELTALCHAHAVQRSDPAAPTPPFFSLEYDLLMLAETGIVLLEMWNALKP